jgi:hypothetical protein
MADRRSMLACKIIGVRLEWPTLHGGAIMRKEWLLSAGAVVLAFLGTQHHNLMMLLLAVGLGNAGMSLMTELPLVRDVMLGMSLLMAAVIGYQISRPNRPAGHACHRSALHCYHARSCGIVGPALRSMRPLQCTPHSRKT